MATNTKKEPEAQNLADVQAQIAAMLAEAKAEAAKIIAEAKASNIASKENAANIVAEAKERKEREAYMDELVEVKLFKDNGKYKEPVFVAVNGENCVIERGVRVKVKRKFAEVLDNSDRQDYETSKLIEQKSEEFKKMDL